MCFNYTLKKGIPVVEVDNKIKGLKFSTKTVEAMLNLIKQAKQ